MKPKHKKETVFANVSSGVRTETITATLSETFSARNLVASLKTDGTVKVCGMNETPIGVVLDEGKANDKVAMRLLSIGNSTIQAVASKAISAGETIILADDGKVQDIENISKGGVVHFEIGVALTTANADGELIEIVPIAPKRVATIFNTASQDQAQRNLKVGNLIAYKYDRVYIFGSKTPTA